MSQYTVSTRRPCPRCGFRIDGEQHFRACVPAAEWPATMAPGYHVPRVVIDGLVIDADKVPQSEYDAAATIGIIDRVSLIPPDVLIVLAENVCRCGFEAKSALGLRSHQRKHAVSV